jgi:GrpB-like predicted nucleotidyltransferase (UPF0157 family)
VGSGPERDQYLGSVLVGGRERVPIVIADPDPAWPARFAAVRDRVRAALGARALDVQHIGSTAVPGLAAKPIVDVLLTVADVADEGGYAGALEAAGFALRVREPGHRMFRTPGRDVHLHVYEPDSPEVADLDLRDRLRHSADDRALYAATKRELARRPWADMNEYADAKSDVIAGILGRARSSGGRSGA